MIENNTQALKNECSRFFLLFPKDHIVTCDDVEAVLTHNREENAFTLFDAIADSSATPQKRMESGVEILQKIQLSPAKDGSSVKTLLRGLLPVLENLLHGTVFQMETMVLLMKI